jgi:hypothetical protein
MADFLERLKVQGVKAVSTGFFRPGFFARSTSAWIRGTPES